MAAVITLPKSIIKKGELVIMPRSEYEELLRTSRRQIELDRDLEQSLKEVKQGKVIGPFDKADDLMKSLSSD